LLADRTGDPAVYFAFLAALFFASAHVLIRRGLVTSNAITGSLVSLSITALTAWGLALFLTPLDALLPQALLYFIVAGIFAPGLGRTLGYMGIERLGVARCMPVVNCSPMFASILAVFFLSEHWGLRNFLGTCLVLAGVVILSRSHLEEKDFRRRDFLIPVLAALVFSLSSILRKLGLQIDNAPPMAAAVTATAGILFAVLLANLQGGWKTIRLSKIGFRWFLLGGLCNSIATISVFYALSHGKIVIVEPLVSSNPAISIFLTALFLRDLEVITRRVLLGASLTVGGTVLIVWS
jgi:uncharacterized membrane protein